MHIAVCDDNIADRKQFERLIKREADRRIAAGGTLYADSYGNAESLLANPMQYDAFFIDMCHTPGVTGSDIYRELLQKGVQAPIVMCCSEIDYRKEEFQGDVIFLEKPIRAEELTACIDHAKRVKDAAVPLIELRTRQDTLYVTEPEIVYAVENGNMLDILLTDGRTVSITSSAENFYSQLENYPVFFSPAFTCVLNGRYIQKLGFRKVTMTDGKTFHVLPGCMNYAKELFARYGKASAH